MAGRDERIAGNEARARLENDERTDWFRTHARILFACECFDPDCPAELSLSREEYEHVRAKPTTFAIYPGHLDTGVEYASEKHDSHWVTEKATEDGQRVSKSTDPRTG